MRDRRVAQGPTYRFLCLLLLQLLPLKQFLLLASQCAFFFLSVSRSRRAIVVVVVYFLLFVWRRVESAVESAMAPLS